MSFWNRFVSPSQAWNCSSSRTDPIGCDSLHCTPFPSTRLTCTEPPPRSMSIHDPPSSGILCAMAMWTSLASSAPVMTSTSKPDCFLARRRNCTRFWASRTALVATARICSIWRPSSFLRNSTSAAKAASMVAVSMEPSEKTPWPSRTGARSCNRTSGGPDSWNSRAMHRMPLEPMSRAARRKGNRGAGGEAMVCREERDAGVPDNGACRR